MLFKKIFITLLAVASFIGIHTSAKAQLDQEAILAEVRTNMQYAFTEESVCYKLFDKVKNIHDPETVLLGYIGAIYIARSRFVPLLEKRESLRLGEEKLEASIKQDPQNLELIFLRYTIQLNLPGFLGYNDNIEADKKFVINNYKKASKVLRAKIVKFVNESDEFTDSEKAKVVN